MYTGFHEYLNIFYYVIITVSSVGYGDYYPVTLMGQALAFVIYIVGAFVVALCLLILFSLIQMNHKERNAFNLIQRLSLNKKIQHHSALTITNFFRLLACVKKKRRGGSPGKGDPDIRLIVTRLLDSLRCIKKFRSQKLRISQSSVLKNMIDTNEYSKIYLNELNDKQVYMLLKVIKVKETIINKKILKKTATIRSTFRT